MLGEVLMGAGILGQGIATYQQGKEAARAAEAENARLASAVSGVQRGLESGSRQMVDNVTQAQQYAKNNPAYRAETIKGYDSYANNSRVGSAMFGQPTSSAEALSRLYGGLQPQTVNAVKYDPTNVNTQLANTTTAGATAIGRDMRAAQLGESDQQTLNQQYALRDQMQKRAFGLVPSIAQQQLASGLDQAQARQAGLAAATRGGANSLLAMRQAQNMGNQAMQDVSRESGIMAMQERAAAEQAYGNQMQGLRADTTQRDLAQAGFEQGAEQANLGKRVSQAGLEANRKLANAAALTQGSQFNTSAMNQGNQFNATNLMNANRDFSNQQFSANMANTANDFAAQNTRANALASAMREEIEGRRASDQFNAAQRQASNDNNAAWQNALTGQILSQQGRGAYAGAEANQAALGVSMQPVASPSVLGSVLNTASPILAQAGANYLSTQLQPSKGA